MTTISNPVVVVVDYEVCNVVSIASAFKRLKCDVRVTSNADDFFSADALVLPGVGSFSFAMKQIRNFGHLDAIRQLVLVEKVPILGICLGFHLLFSESFEFGLTEGLGLLNGSCVQMTQERGFISSPHVGWTKCTTMSDSKLICPDSFYYFCHSFCVEEIGAGVIQSHASNGSHFVSSVEFENICGVQFHPEKSQVAGLDLIKKFCTAQGLVLNDL